MEDARDLPPAREPSARPSREGGNPGAGRALASLREQLAGLLRHQAAALDDIGDIFCASPQPLLDRMQVTVGALIPFSGAPHVQRDLRVLARAATRLVQPERAAGGGAQAMKVTA